MCVKQRKQNLGSKLLTANLAMGSEQKVALLSPHPSFLLWSAAVAGALFLNIPSYLPRPGLLYHDPLSFPSSK